MRIKKPVFLLILAICAAYFSLAQNIQFELLTEADGLSSNVVSRITQDDQGFLWITTPNGINRFDGRNFLKINPSDKISFPQGKNAISTDETFPNLMLRNGDIFSIQNNNTLTHSILKTDKIETYTLDFLLEKPITQLIQDNAGIIWGATEEGLLKIKYQPSLFDTYLTNDGSYNFGNFRMRGITEDEAGNIYFSYYNSIQVLNPEKNQVTPLPLGQTGFSNTPFDLMVFKNHLWTNSSKKINLSNYTVTTVLPSNKARDFDNGNFMVDKNGNLWLGRNGDLWKYDETKDQLILSDFSKNINTEEITFLLPSEDENFFWVGTNENGLYKIDFSKGISGSVRNFSTSNSNLKSNFVRVLFEDKNETLWIGTPGGLFELNIEKSSISRYSVKDGLPNDNINSILSEGDSALWIGTDLGLSRFDKKEKSFINFFVRDGLSDNEFNRISFHKAKNGRMYFGGLNGITAFFPNEVMAAYRKQQKNSKVVLTSFIKQIDKDDTPVQELWNNEKPNLDIFYEDKNYTFEFALTDYLASEEVQYSYQLKGYDYDFTPPSNHAFAKYDNLPKGEYTLLVKAKDAKGGWNPNPLSLNIKVHPPWWKSNWTYLIYALLFGLLGWIVYGALKTRWALKAQLQNEHQEAERLKEVNEFKTRLYANITHEFRTPLTVILGLSDQVKSDVDNISPKKIKDHMGLISSNGKNLLHLINQMLDLSKLESSSMTIKLIQGDIISFLKSIIDSFAFFAETQKVQLSFHSEMDKLVMDFDKDKVLKIVSNLVSNGLKFTPENGKVQLLAEVDGNQNLILKVSDTGIGIPKEAVPHIFDRFFQATTEALQKQIGTGIGLSLVQELVRLFDGKISVESKIGFGTTFTAELPIHNNAPTETELPKISSIQEAVDAYTIWSQGKIADVQTTSKNNNEELPRLLLVEDNKDIITYLKTILEPLYQLQIATNGKIGVDMATKEIPDIILSDVMMPVMDGFEVLNFLKNDERTSHIPVVMLTARSEIQSKLHGLERGADAYLSKPFHKGELLIRLEKLIELRKKLQTRYAGFEVQPPSEEKAVQIEDAFLQKLRGIVEENIDNPSFGIPDLCRAVTLSRMQVHRKLKALSGKPTAQFIRSIRLQKAKTLLLSTEMNISEVAYEVGFNDANYFSRTFAMEYGMSPTEFLAGRN